MRTYIKFAGVRLPHACGDVPIEASFERSKKMSSPRMWGCSHRTHGYRHRLFVFPTHVGMFLCKRERACESGSLPHACGVFPKKQKFFFFACLSIVFAIYVLSTNRYLSVLFQIICVCAVRVPVYWTGYGSVEDTRHISARFVNLTFHLRRNHHVRRICSRS